MCTIHGCPRIFKNTNTWYKHIRKSHFNEYTRRGVQEESMEESDSDDELPSSENESIDFLNSSESVHPVQSRTPLITKEQISGKLIKLKEKHRISCAAVNEIVELVELVCNDITSKSMSAIIDSGVTNGMDMTSEFFTGLPEVLEGINYPLDMLKTNYRQQVYVAKNLLYVVRNTGYKHFVTMHS